MVGLDVSPAREKKFPDEEKSSALSIATDERARRVSRRIARGSSLSSEDLGDVFVELTVARIGTSMLSTESERSSLESVAEDRSDDQVGLDGRSDTGPSSEIAM